jgi:hypothetical protein
MNNCSNNGTCDANGTCICKPGFKGADCSAEAVKVDQEFETYVRGVYGPTWTSLQVEQSAGRIRIHTNLPADIYVKKGTNSNPTEFDYDMAFLSQLDVSLCPKMFSALREGYSVAIYQQAYIEGSNEFLNDTLTVDQPDKLTVAFKSFLHGAITSLQNN